MSNECEMYNAADRELMRQNEEWAEQDIEDAKMVVARRDIAAMAMQGILSKNGDEVAPGPVAKAAVKYADVLLKELAKEQQG